MHVQSKCLCTYKVHIYVRTVHIVKCTPMIYEMIVSKFARGLGLKEREREREMRRKDKFLSQDDLGVALGSKNSTDQTTSGEQFSDIM